MFDPANQAAILVPMLAVAALTLLAFVRMAAARGAAAKGMDMNFYRAYQGGAEPEAAVVAVRHYGNLLELPTLFYPAWVALLALGAVSGWALVWAWGYVAARLVQSAIHLTYNNPGHRGGAFVLGVLCMTALWVTLALAIFARL
ncbi:MAG: MAPEG family protein [Novosphingobium sp.]